MKIHLPINIQQKLIQALEKAGNYEIGGVLMGEHIAEAEFRIVDLTIQEQLGNVAFFIRLVTDIVKPLKGFFKRTGYNYRKFNYLEATATIFFQDGQFFECELIMEN